MTRRGYSARRVGFGSTPVTVAVLAVALSACGAATVDRGGEQPAGDATASDGGPGNDTPGGSSQGGDSRGDNETTHDGHCVSNDDCLADEVCESDGGCWNPLNVKPPRFSVPRGHYDEPFTVTLASDTPGAQIHFTTDAQWPSEVTGAEGKSVAITTTTVLRAIAYKPGLAASDVVTHTYVFVEDVMRQPKNAQGSPDGTDKVGWGSTEMLDSVVDEHTDRVREALTSLPVLSVSGDPVALFGNDVDVVGLMDVHAKGEEPEEEVSLELIVQDGDHEFLGHAGMHITGNAGRTATKKSLALEFRSKYGQPTLHYPLIPGSHVRVFDELRLRSFWATAARPYFMQWVDDLQRIMSGEAQHGRFVQLYVNGIYWGLYNLSEIAKEGFGEAHLGDDKDNWTRVRGNAALADELLRNAGDLSDPARYTSLEQKLNVEHYIDLIVLLMWLVDVQNRTLGTEIRAIQNQTAGVPYYVYMWDPEESKTHPGFLEFDPLPWALDKNPLLMALLANDDFRVTFADRIHKHLGEDGTLAGAPAANALLGRVDEVDEAYVAEVARWGKTDSFGGWRVNGLTATSSLDGDVAFLRDTWIPRRASILMGYLRQAGLYPALEAPSFSQEGGEVSAGFQLSIAGSGGTLYYTTNGSDPRRAQGGAVHTGAVSGRLPARVTIDQTTHVRARLKDGQTWSALTEGVFSVGQDYAKLRITELMYNPPIVGSVPGDEVEFLELKNTGSSPIDLTGSYFSRGLTFRFRGTRIIAPGQFVVLVKNPARFAETHPAVAIGGTYAGSLANGGEWLELVAQDGTAIATMNYQDRAPWPTAADGAGFSLVPADSNPAGDPSDASHWRASTNPGGSPGVDDP